MGDFGVIPVAFDCLGRKQSFDFSHMVVARITFLDVRLRPIADHEGVLEKDERVKKCQFNRNEI